MAKNVGYLADVLVSPEPPVAAPNEFEETSVDFFAIGRTLRVHRKTVLGTGLAFLLIATVLAFFMRDRYTATATFIPPNSGIGSSSAMSGQLAQLSGLGGFLGSKTNGDLYAGLLRSRTILDKMITRFDFRKVYRKKTLVQTEMQLSGHTEVFINPRDGIVSVTFTDHDPARARDVADAYLQELQQASATLALTESSGRRLFYEQRMRDEKNLLADAEVALKRSQEKTGLIAPAGQTASELEAISQLRAQIANRRVRLASLLHDETEQNPDVLRLRSEISNLEGQVAQRVNGRPDPAGGGISRAEVPGLALDYVRLAREVSYHQTLFDMIGRQYEAARLDEAHDTPLQLLDRAATPELPSGPPRLQYIAGSTLFGLFVSSIYVLFRYYFLPRLRLGPPGFSRFAKSS